METYPKTLQIPAPSPLEVSSVAADAQALIDKLNPEQIKKLANWAKRKSPTEIGIMLQMI